MNTDPELLEAIAKAVEEFAVCDAGYDVMNADEVARFVIDAIQELGLVVVPREPTQAMLGMAVAVGRTLCAEFIPHGELAVFVNKAEVHAVATRYYHGMIEAAVGGLRESPQPNPHCDTGNT
jgi:hypothetical protein